jgi:hypothetical protein
MQQPQYSSKHEHFAQQTLDHQQRYRNSRDSLEMTRGRSI